MTIIQEEQALVASVMESPGERLSHNICTALAYWPFYDSVEASKVAEGVAKCLDKGWRPTPRIVAITLEPQYKHWTNHKIFKDALPLSCAESLALHLIPHYANKRLIGVVAQAYEQMLTKPESARAVARQLKVNLEEWV